MLKFRINSPINPAGYGVEQIYLFDQKIIRLAQNNEMNSTSYVHLLEVIQEN